MMPDKLAAHCHQILDPLHLVCYFAPEVERQLTGIGLDAGSMSYLAGRAAPFGPVGPGVVAATFYNFSPALVARHIPAAWAKATPKDIVAARLAGVDLALRSLLGNDTVAGADVAEAADLARRAAAECTPDGRPLYAAHADLDWPTEPHLVLWHAITLLREHRGDGHIAVLVESGLSGLAALITDNATGHSLFDREQTQSTRGWTDAQWQAEFASLIEQGILDPTGLLTERGHRLRARLEDATNVAAAQPYRRLGSERAQRLHDLCLPLSQIVLDSAVLPSGAGSHVVETATA